MAMCVFAYLRVRVVWVPKKSRKNYSRHHLKKILSFCLRIFIFVFKSKKSQPNNMFKVLQNLAPFGSRPIGGAFEVLLTKVVNWQYC
jgi:hypothetical protein